MTFAPKKFFQNSKLCTSVAYDNRGFVDTATDMDTLQDTIIFENIDKNLILSAMRDVILTT